MMTGVRLFTESMPSISPHRESQSEHIRHKNDRSQRYKEVLLRNHGAHPLIAAAIQATPPNIPAKPAAIPRLLASVGAVTKIAAVVRVAATVHRTAAIILYALELTFVSPVPVILSLRETDFRNNGLG
jgi:hypothetical protein